MLFPNADRRQRKRVAPVAGQRTAPRAGGPGGLYVGSGGGTRVPSGSSARSRATTGPGGAFPAPGISTRPVEVRVSPGSAPGGDALDEERALDLTRGGGAWERVDELEAARLLERGEPIRAVGAQRVEIERALVA